MERNLVPAGVVFLMLILFASVAGARLCESQSHTYKGTCTNNHNCAIVCQREGRGFTGGRCRGFWRKCYCTKIC
ncbi:defensin-like protein 1 [Phoenix dactylifera]|uniref:Defensin-like protein 1 n=1 Tax=Phoenix dactylifera TaxID=42345 RepID=A0A8B8ZTV0_PHODC|nr:defensin-like protein 1 [Phoenix dactylifera]